MTDKEMIEEMARVIFERGVALDGTDFVFGLNGSDHFERIATAIYNAGYRKIPEGSVVINNEDYDNLIERAEYAERELALKLNSLDGSIVLSKEECKKLKEFNYNGFILNRTYYGNEDCKIRKEVYDKLNTENQQLKEQNVALTDKLGEILSPVNTDDFHKSEELCHAHKEMVREILKEILFVKGIKGWQENKQLVEFCNSVVDKIEELAKQFGVEVEE